MLLLLLLLLLFEDSFFSGSGSVAQVTTLFLAAIGFRSVFFCMNP